MELTKNGDGVIISKNRDVLLISQNHQKKSEVNTMKTRDLNILALPEPIKLSFQKRIDEIGVGLHRRFEALLPDKGDQFDLDHINYLLCRWEGAAIDFERGIDMNFGRWQDDMEFLYNEIILALTEAEEALKAKGGEPK